MRNRALVSYLNLQNYVLKGAKSDLLAYALDICVGKQQLLHSRVFRLEVGSCTKSGIHGRHSCKDVHLISPIQLSSMPCFNSGFEHPCGGSPVNA